MSSKIFVSRDSEDILKIVSSSQQSSSTVLMKTVHQHTFVSDKKERNRMNQIPLNEQSYNGNDSRSVGLCQFSMSDYYNDATDECKERRRDYYVHHGSADSAITTSSIDTVDSACSSIDSNNYSKMRKLSRQIAVDVEDGPSPDRSSSVDSGFTDVSIEESSSDLKLAKKLSRAWVKRAEFRKKIEDSEDVTSRVKKKIDYVS